MNVIKKILWATDGSKESEEALKLTLYIARKFDSEVVCLYVNEVRIPVTHLYPSYEEIIVDISEKTEAKFRENFKKIAEENPDLRFSSKVVKSTIVEGIIATSTGEDADLVVMGKRGHGLIGSALLGSNTLNVLRNSSIPVLSVKLEEPERDYDINKILVAFDVSDTAESALWTAIGLAEKLGASIEVIYVFWINGNVYEISPALIDELIGHASFELETRVGQIKDEYVRIHQKALKTDIKTRVLSGASPGITIVDYASESGFDLIAVSTHGRKGFERLILGSETEKIIREAHCPVLALKP